MSATAGGSGRGPAAGSRRVALVTGGTRGIGLGCARALAAGRFDLALVGVRAEAEAEEPLGELRASGAEVLYVPADVGDDDAADRIVAAVRGRFGRLDVLVNNAGVAPKERRDILEATRESFDRLLRINTRGPYFLTQAAAKLMMETGAAGAAPPLGAAAAAPPLGANPVAPPLGAAAAAAGAPRPCVVFVTSISAETASINRGDYCISKAGLSMAARLWAVRLAEFGISVYEVRPGVIRTDMTAKVAARYDELFAGGLALQNRWGTPEDIGRAVAMLARGDLPYSSGAVITVDGGLAVPRL
jgi:NAD(P)-dependent dehydrogenase (short-subunit alcohol dehydrogenase family)